MRACIARAAQPTPCTEDNISASANQLLINHAVTSALDAAAVQKIDVHLDISVRDGNATIHTAFLNAQRAAPSLGTTASMDSLTSSSSASAAADKSA